MGAGRELYLIKAITAKKAPTMPGAGFDIGAGSQTSKLSVATIPAARTTELPA